MSYRLQPDEALPAGVTRMAREQIDAALNYLQAPPEELDTAVHESRKCLKKLRGLLRLVRKEIGKDVFQRENTCFRDAGRLLSEVRDSAVRIETLDNLLADYSSVVEENAYDQMRQTLVIFYNATRQRVIVEEFAPGRASRMITNARRRVETWPVSRHEFAAVSGGLQKVYKRGRNRMAEAASDPSTEARHEWRKRVKYLWYNVRILRPIWRKPMASLAAEIHSLADDLGDDHDLAMLRALVEKRPLLLHDETAREVLLTLIDQKQADLQADAFRQGRRIYAEEPAAFVNRLGAYWQTWQT